MKRLIIGALLGGMFGFGYAIAIDPDEPVAAIGVGMAFSSAVGGLTYIFG